MLTRHARSQRSDEVDAKFGFERYLATTDRMGWLINMHPVCGTSNNYGIASHLSLSLSLRLTFLMRTSVW